MNCCNRYCPFLSPGPDFGKLCELSELCKLSPPAEAGPDGRTWVARPSGLISRSPDFGKSCELSELCGLSPQQRLVGTAEGGWPEPIQDAIGLEWAPAQPLPLRHAPLPGLGPVASGAILRLSKMRYQKRLGATLLLTKTAGKGILRRDTDRDC